MVVRPRQRIVTTLKTSKVLRWSVRSALIVVIVAFGWWLLRSWECYLVKGDFLQYSVSTARSHLEHNYKWDDLRLDTDFSDPFMSELESRSLITTVDHLRENANRGTWRIAFASSSHCFSDRDFLELTYEIRPTGSTHVECAAQFVNSEMFPRGCSESNSSWENVDY